jgi:phosphoglycerate dehydrogenase-like enzyme
LKILATFDLPEEYVKRIENHYHMQVSVCKKKAPLPDAIRDADILIVSWRLPAGSVASAHSLKWIHSIGAGVDGILTPDVLKSNVVVTSSSGIHREPISEHVLAFMLSFVRRFHTFARQQMRKEWKRYELEELAGKTLGIIGLGEIGSEIAVKAKAFGMRVIAVKRTPGQKPSYVDALWTQDRLKNLLGESDFVVLSLPLTSETRGFIGEPEMKAMKKSAYFINISRGKIVQEAKLIQALREGWIAGAGLDVFAEEPLPEKSELWEMPNVIITPHVAGSNPRYTERAMAIFEENLQRFLEGKELVNLVDKRLGY